MNVFSDFIGIEDGCNDRGEQMYEFEFTMMQIVFIKAALIVSGLEYSNNRNIYKMLCEAGCDEEEKQMIAKYE